MVYAKVTFSAIVPLNITNLNILGSQYAEMQSTIVAHNPSTYYTKLECDNLYPYADNDGHTEDDSGPNAATIDGYTKAQLLASVPTGLMVWYGAALSNLPAGWHLADGTLGTRNCVNKYIIGADEDTTLDTGGNDVFTPTGSISIATHVLTLAEIPSHNHTWTETNVPGYAENYDKFGYYGNVGGSFGYRCMNYAEVGKTSGYVGSNQAHGHAGSTVTLGQIDNRPPSKAIFLIQKV
jgi:hypothetical protein